MSNVLIVAAHPDDEVLGIGGIAIKHARKGDHVRSVIMCEGESLRYKQDVGLSAATEAAAAVMGVEHVYTPRFPDQRLDTYTLTEIIKPLEKISDEFHPNIVYCQSGLDANRDHQIVFEAANIAFRPISPWLELFASFYSASSSEWGVPDSFKPDTWVDISDVLEQKIEAFSKYTTEVREYPHPRSLEALRFQSHFWGNQCCMDSAEVLMTIRKTVR